MLLSVSSPVLQTQIFAGLLFVALLLSLRRETDKVTLSPELTSELKGFALLAVVLSHIGYFLVDDHRFLYPLSVSAGVGVNLFLFLSGYGLTYSMMHKSSTILEFYKKRVTRIFLPLWITLAALYVIDRVFLHLSYPLLEMVQSFFGFFPVASLYYNVNSPLWYITLTLFFYLIFPLLFSKKRPVLSAFFIGAVAFIVSRLTLDVDSGVQGAYQMHLFAFPLGVFFAALFFSKIRLVDIISQKIQAFFSEKTWISYVIRAVFLIALFWIFAHFSIEGDIGKGVWIEQRTSLLTMFSVILLFLLKPFKTNALNLLGIYSYEIYLIHWPMLYRYDFLYANLPAGIATFAHLLLFLLIGYGFQRLTQVVLKKINI